MPSTTPEETFRFVQSGGAQTPKAVMRITAEIKPAPPIDKRTGPAMSKAVLIIHPYQLIILENKYQEI